VHALAGLCEPADVIVLAAPGMDALEKEKRILAGSRIDLARALIGVAVKAGAPVPDLSTSTPSKAALLKR
jgi:molybdate transport system substrate-binding protein